jgi:hypothetical protein
MSSIDCRNVRQEIEEVGQHDLLGAAARNHVRSCEACAAFDNNEQKLRGLVASLGGVEAPADFDFKLRARLAANRNVTFINRFAVRSAAFASLLLLLGVVLVLVNNRSQINPVAVSTTPSVPSGTVAKTNSPVTPASAVISEPAPVLLPAAGQTTVVSSRRSRNNPMPQFVASSGKTKSTDLSASPARVLRPETNLGSAVFPLGTSYDSLKVSVDDGRGISRTISLPRVSFGSSRALAQNPTPIMASARDSW